MGNHRLQASESLPTKSNKETGKNSQSEVYRTLKSHLKSSAVWGAFVLYQRCDQHGMEAQVCRPSALNTEAGDFGVGSHVGFKDTVSTDQNKIKTKLKKASYSCQEQEVLWHSVSPPV